MDLNTTQMAGVFTTALMDRDERVLKAACRQIFEMQADMHFDDPTECAAPCYEDAKGHLIDLLGEMLAHAKRVL